MSDILVGICIFLVMFLIVLDSCFFYFDIKKYKGIKKLLDKHEHRLFLLTKDEMEEFKKLIK